MAVTPMGRCIYRIIGKDATDLHESGESDASGLRTNSKLESCEHSFRFGKRPRGKVNAKDV